MLRYLLDYIITLLLAAGLLALLVCLGGCSVLSGRPSAGPTMPDLSPEVALPTLPDVVPSVLLIGFVLSIVSIGLGFGKLGGITAVACVAGLLLRSALAVPWLIYAAALVVLAGMLLVIAGIVIKNKALKEIIVGVQRLRVGCGETDTLRLTKDDITTVLKNTQSKETQEVVKQVKSKLKLKGEIQ